MLADRLARGANRASACLMVLLLASCGGGDGDSARPEISPTRTPTATLPSLEVPSPTRSPDRIESPELPSATRSPERTESPGEPEAQPSSEPSAQEPATGTPAPTAQETGAPDTAADEPVQESADDEGVPPSVWWLLGAVVVGSIVGIPWTIRARRRSTWRQELAAQEGELAWFARELLPGLRQAGSWEQVAGGWTVGRPRVAAAEDRLTVLESAAPGEPERQRARSLRDAARQARVDMERLVGPEPSDTLALDLDGIIADLEGALRPSPDTSPAPGEV